MNRDFGSVHVNPWITLFAIDLPSVVALSFLRPCCHLPGAQAERSAAESKDLLTSLLDFLKPLPSIPRFAVTACLGLTILGVTTPILAINKPAKVTARYEVLEPETWVGKELPILEHVDIAVPRGMPDGKTLIDKGTWLVLLYHYDCPDCGRAIPMYEQMARDLEGNEDFLRIAFIAVPPYGLGPVSENSPCILGRLPETKEWFVTTPAVALLADGQVKAAWEEKAPNLDIILQKMAKDNKVDEKQKLFTLKTHFVRL